MKKKIIISSSLLTIMMSFIVWLSYMSEYKYINNPKGKTKGKIHINDVVSIRKFGNIENNLDIGMVVQIDRTSYKHNDYALVKLSGRSDQFKDILINGDTANFKIVGRGTFYHKVNSLVGFNLMFTSIVFMVLFSVIIGGFLIYTLNEYFEWNM